MSSAVQKKLQEQSTHIVLGVLHPRLPPFTRYEVPGLASLVTAAIRSKTQNRV